MTISCLSGGWRQRLNKTFVPKLKHMIMWIRIPARQKQMVMIYFILIVKLKTPKKILIYNHNKGHIFQIMNQETPSKQQKSKKKTKLNEDTSKKIAKKNPSLSRNERFSNRRRNKSGNAKKYRMMILVTGEFPRSRRSVNVRISPK